MMSNRCINLAHYYAEYNADILILDLVQGDWFIIGQSGRTLFRHSFT